MSASKFKKIDQEQYQILDSINLKTADSLLKEGRKLIKEHKNLIIDFSQAKQSTSVAIALMLQLLADAKMNQSSLSFTKIPDSIIELAKISNVADLI